MIRTPHDAKLCSTAAARFAVHPELCATGAVRQEPTISDCARTPAVGSLRLANLSSSAAPGLRVPCQQGWHRGLYHAAVAAARGHAKAAARDKAERQHSAIALRDRFDILQCCDIAVRKSAYFYADMTELVHLLQSTQAAAIAATSA